MLTLALFGGPLTPDVVQQITLVEAADQIPIVSMLMAAGQMRGTVNPNPTWWTSALPNRRTQINNAGAAYDGSTTTLVVDDASVFLPNHIVVCEATGEILLVLTSNGTTQITVRRGVGSTAGAAGSVANNAYLSVIGTAAGEGSPSLTPQSVGKTEATNTVQIFRESVEISGTLLRSSTDTQAERARQRLHKYQDFIQKIELAAIHGQRSTNVTDSASRVARTMGGIREAVTTNVTSGMGNISEDTFVAALEACFAHGSGAKVMFAGSTAVAAVNKLFRDRVRYTAPDAPVGLKVSRILTPFGQLDLVVHRGLKGGFAGDALVLDMGELELRPLEGGQPGGGDFPQNGRIQFRPNIQDKDVDGVKDEWFAEHTLTWGNQQAHAQLRGITGVA